MPNQIDIYDPPEQGSDYVVQFKIKNGPLLRAIRMRGYRTMKKFSEDAGFAISLLYRYLSLTRAPINKKGEWFDSVLKMSALLRLPPESLFPEQHLDRALAKNNGEFEITFDEVRALVTQEPVDPEQALADKELQQKLFSLMIERVSPREHRVLAERFGFDGAEKTLEEIGNEFGVGRERIRQMEMHALRRLRNPTTMRKLRRLTTEIGVYENYKAETPERHYVPEWKREEQEHARTKSAIMEAVTVRGLGINLTRLQGFFNDIAPEKILQFCRELEADGKLRFFEKRGKVHVIDVARNGANVPEINEHENS
jgi:RNA polymerase sigma factor (sigma-70 family)